MRHLAKEDMEEILALRAKRVLLKDIAERFRVSDAQISNIINGKHIPRRLTTEPEVKTRSPYDPVEFKEEDFSKLPNDVYFKHTKACNFIG
jgi:hypothetical protein